MGRLRRYLYAPRHLERGTANTRPGYIGRHRPGTVLAMALVRAERWLSDAILPAMGGAEDERS